VVPWGDARRTLTVPTACPKEFLDEVGAVAQWREAGVMIKQIAGDFRI